MLGRTKAGNKLVAIVHKTDVTLPPRVACVKDITCNAHRQGNSDA